MELFMNGIWNKMACICMSYGRFVVLSESYLLFARYKLYIYFWYEPNGISWKNTHAFRTTWIIWYGCPANVSNVKWKRNLVAWWSQIKKKHDHSNVKCCKYFSLASIWNVNSLIKMWILWEGYIYIGLE